MHIYNTSGKHTNTQPHMEYSRRLAQMIQVQKNTINFFKKKNADADADYANTTDRHIYPSNLFYPPD